MPLVPRLFFFCWVHKTLKFLKKSLFCFCTNVRLDPAQSRLKKAAISQISGQCLPKLNKNLEFREVNDTLINANLLFFALSWYVIGRNESLFDPKKQAREALQSLQMMIWQDLQLQYPIVLKTSKYRISTNLSRGF